MRLATIDWAVILVFFIAIFVIGWIASRTAGKSTSEFFLGGRKMPWWLLGISMVACTFSADTPNLVTGFVREYGVAKNWEWWAFLITGMITVFIYAKLWRRSSTLTDLEFYELRYKGKTASFLRGFRALYLGLFVNTLIMGTVTLAAIKIAAVMFGMAPIHTVIIGSVAVVFYAGLGGIKGVIWADFFQYSIAMAGAVLAAVVAVKQPVVGGLSGLLSNPAIAEKLSIFPDFGDPSNWIPLLIIPIAVQWWAVWYPGAEPGGGGYIAQRMLAAKDEKNAMGATLLFNFAHYALRPWAWIIVALASLLVFPELTDISEQFPSIPKKFMGHDVAYPAMISLLPTGALGVVVASLIAAFLSTIGTHLNWGSSYLVHDFYKRFLKPGAGEKELVRVGRLSTVILMILTAVFALTILENATNAFNILLLSGAGSGAIYLLRWFWWRINAWTEIVAMISSTVVAFILVFGFDDATLHTGIIDGSKMKLLIATGFTTIAWLVATFLGGKESDETLVSFYKMVHPGGPGWARIRKLIGVSKEDGSVEGRRWDVPYGILCAFLGCLGIYCALFSIGNFVYGEMLLGYVLMAIFALCSFFLIRLWARLNIE